MATRIGDTLLAVVPKSDLQQVIDEFMVSRRVGTCSKRTIEYCSDELRWFCQYMESQGVEQGTEVAPTHLCGFLLHMVDLKTRVEERKDGGF